MGAVQLLSEDRAFPRAENLSEICQAAVFNSGSGQFDPTSKKRGGPHLRG